MYLPGRHSEMRGAAEASRTGAHIRWLDDYSAKITDQAMRLKEAQANYQTKVERIAVDVTAAGISALNKVLDANMHRLKDHVIRVEVPASKANIRSISPAELSSPAIQSLGKRLAETCAGSVDRWEVLKPS